MRQKHVVSISPSAIHMLHYLSKSLVNRPDTDTKLLVGDKRQWGNDAHACVNGPLFVPNTLSLGGAFLIRHSLCILDSLPPVHRSITLPSHFLSLQRLMMKHNVACNYIPRTVGVWERKCTSRACEVEVKILNLVNRMLIIQRVLVDIASIPNTMSDAAVSEVECSRTLMIQNKPSLS